MRLPKKERRSNPSCRSCASGGWNTRGEGRRAKSEERRAKSEERRAKVYVKNLQFFALRPSSFALRPYFTNSLPSTFNTFVYFFNERSTMKMTNEAARAASQKGEIKSFHVEKPKCT